MQAGPDHDAPVLVIYTGGTLGMVPSPHGLVPGADIEARLRRALASLPPADQARLPDFRVLDADEPIDSSSATPLDWQRLATRVAERYRDHAGIVILQGTDTLAWTASSLAYQLQGIDRPVVLSGAMRPLEATGGDAIANLETALRFAADPRLQEVAICFAGRLLRGCRTRKWQTHDGQAFTSPNHPLLGECVGGDTVLYPGRGLEMHQRGGPRFELPGYAALAQGGVARIALWPGLAAWQLEAWVLDDRVRGALLEVWGAGNLPDDPALSGALARASGEGKLIAAISQCPHGSLAMDSYAAGHGLLQAGVLAGDDMTPEAAWAKLLHLLAQPLDEAERRRRFLTPLVGER